jgi:hypothetical protein
MILQISAMATVRERLVWASLHLFLGTFLLTMTWGSHLQRNQSLFKDNPLADYRFQLQAGKPFDLQEATEKIFLGTQHESVRRITFHENWVQWLAGFAYEPLQRTQNTDLLIDGQIAECSERSQILKTLAEECGYPCRFVGLGGHVVVEVAMEHDWCVADPEFGLTFSSNAYTLSQKSQQALIEVALSSRGVSDEQIENYLRILQSEEDNTTLTIGEPLSPRLKLAEEVCMWLSWLLPMACYGAALSCFMSARYATN